VRQRPIQGGSVGAGLAAGNDPGNFFHRAEHGAELSRLKEQDPQGYRCAIEELRICMLRLRMIGESKIVSFVITHTAAHSGFGNPYNWARRVARIRQERLKFTLLL
jgi:hypothetical protein